MSDDWLDELQKLREEDEVRQRTQVEALDTSVLNRQNQAGQALRQCDAHNLLRKVQKVLLGGKGVIDIFDTTQQYDRAIALIWQGPISNTRLPRPEDPDDYLYILVGAKGDKVYVNHRRLKNVTPEALKAALLWASKKPERQASSQD